MAVEFLAKQGLAFRGHRDDKVDFSNEDTNCGNFIATLQLMAKGHHTLGNIVAGNCCWLQCFLVYDSDVSVLRVSGNCFPQIENLSIPGNMFLQTSKGRQIYDVAERRSQSAIPFDAYSRGDRGEATKVRVSWSSEMSSAEESIKGWRKFGQSNV